MTLYALLDVPEDASDAEIKRAYRDAAKKYHPDLNPDAEPGRFARVSEAHEVLSDGSKRAAYDAALRAERDAASTKHSSNDFNNFSGFETYANDFRAGRTNDRSQQKYYGESDLKRRERLARARADDAAAAAAWWRREKAASLAARVRFRQHVARAEGRRADRAGEKLKNAGWVVRRGATRTDVAVFVSCVAFVAAAGVAFFGRDARDETGVGKRRLERRT
jgi:curved DNA-binding protein CbpA